MRKNAIFWFKTWKKVLIGEVDPFDPYFYVSVEKVEKTLSLDEMNSSQKNQNSKKFNFQFQTSKKV